MIFFLAFVFVTGFISAQEIALPIKASADKKYLVDQNNTPVFLNGCSSWQLAFALSYDEAKTYLLDRKAKKFNALLVHIVPARNNEGRQKFGPAFFNDDLDKPNEAFFQHLDSLIELCNQLNIIVFIAPMYLSCCNDGWLEIVQQYKDGEAKCRRYGAWFANRYKKYPNIVWLSGGDHNPVPEAMAFTEGIVSVDTTHLHTFHAHPGKSTGEIFKGEKWQTLSACYTYFPAMERDTAWQYKHVYAMMYEEMLNNYRLPYFLIESAYEDERYSTTQIIRRQAWWSLLSGASGEIFGQRDIYQLNNNLMSAMNEPGSKSMEILTTFVQSIAWYKLRPDWAHTMFVSGRGTFNSTQYPGGEDYATGAFKPDSSLAILYMPSYRKVGVNMSRFKHAVTVKWFDPSAGIYKTVSGSFPNKDVEYFEPPSFKNAKGFDDWVLILESK